MGDLRGVTARGSAGRRGGPPGLPVDLTVPFARDVVEDVGWADLPPAQAAHRLATRCPGAMTPTALSGSRGAYVSLTPMSRAYRESCRRASLTTP